MENCNELILRNIVRIEVYPSSQCTFTVPPQVVAHTFAEGSYTLGTPSIAVAFSYTDDDAEMSELPTLKITNERQQAGNTYKYDLQIPVSMGQDAVQQAVDALQGVDFNVVYHFPDGTKKVSYGLPNASICDVEDNYSSSSSSTVKITLVSMSNLIELG